MKLATAAALLLACAGLVACGSSTVNQRQAIVQLIRADATKKGNSYVSVHRVHISRLDPHYAVAQEWFGGATGPTGAHTWILKRRGSTWRPTSVEYMFPLCSAAPAKVLKELVGAPRLLPAGRRVHIDLLDSRQIRSAALLPAAGRPRELRRSFGRCLVRDRIDRRRRTRVPLLHARVVRSPGVPVPLVLERPVRRNVRGLPPCALHQWPPAHRVGRRLEPLRERRV